MTLEEAKALRPGTRVFWDDPDDGICSKYLVIQLIEWPGDDDVVRITCENGSELECFAQELIIPMFICAA